MSQQAFEEKRRFPRIPSKALVEVSLLSFPMSDEPEGEARSVDIGGGGVCFFSGKAFEDGAVLSLRLHLRGWSSHKKPHSRLMDVASEGPLSALAEVVWCKPTGEGTGYEVGVKFLDVYEDDYKALLSFLEA